MVQILRLQYFFGGHIWPARLDSTARLEPRFFSFDANGGRAEVLEIKPHPNHEAKHSLLNGCSHFLTSVLLERISTKIYKYIQLPSIASLVDLDIFTFTQLS